MTKLKSLTLEIDKIEDLFVGPGVDVERLQLDAQRGMDDLMDELRAKRLPENIHTTIVFPDTSAEEGASPEQLQTLIDAYCRANIRRNRFQIQAIRREGLMEMFPATLLLIFTVFTSLVITKTSPFSDENNQLLIAGLGILSWVGMWRPLGALLYDWWEPHRDNRIYERMLRMQVSVQIGVG